MFDYVKRGSILGEVQGVTFYYGGWNETCGWHLIYTDDENFHVSKKLTLSNIQGILENIYVNYYA